MFTGLVEGIGEVVRLRSLEGARELSIRSAFPRSDLTKGASISVHGVCLTLIDTGTEDGTFRVQAAPETLRRTTLGRLRTGDRVHLERSLRPSDRMGGHIVQGHVDGVGRVRKSARMAGEKMLEIAVAPGMQRYLVEKGSVCVDGVSLTVGRTGPGWFRVHLIPATLAVTLLGSYRVGRPLNLEMDIMAKYVESALRAQGRLRSVCRTKEKEKQGNGRAEMLDKRQPRG